MLLQTVVINKKDTKHCLENIAKINVAYFTANKKIM